MISLRTLYANRWLRYLTTLLLLGLVAIKVEPTRLAHAVAAAKPGYLAVALVLTVPFLYCKIARWYLMLRLAGIDATFNEASISLIGGMGLALVTPARLGELVRVAYLRDRHKMKVGGLVLVDKGFDVLVLTALSVAGAWRLLGVGPALALLIVTASGLFVVYRASTLAGYLRLLFSRTPVAQKVNSACSGLEAFTPRSISFFLLITLGSFVVVFVQFGTILLSWRAWSPEIVFLTFPLVVLTNVVPITIGGLGIREAMSALLLSHYGVSPANAAVAAFLMFVFNTALPGIIGVFVLPPASPRPSTDPLGVFERP